jgi:hypothetical protein
MDLRNILPRLEHIMYFGLKDSVMQDNLPWSKEGKQSFIKHSVIKGIKELTAENERLQRVVEQAIGFGDFRIIHVGAGEYEIKRPDIDNWGKEQDYPDLFAQLKGADRG